MRILGRGGDGCQYERAGAGKGTLMRHFLQLADAALRAVGQRADALRGSSTGSAHRRGTTIRADGCGRSHPRSTDCRGHSRNKYAPAVRSADMRITDTFSRQPSSAPHVALDKTVHRAHKDSACLCVRESVGGPGFCHELARAFVYSASANSIPRQRMCRGVPTMRTSRDHRLPIRSTLNQSDERVRYPPIKQEIKMDARETYGYFRRDTRPNLKFQRMSTTVHRFF